VSTYVVNQALTMGTTNWYHLVYTYESSEICGYYGIEGTQQTDLIDCVAISGSGSPCCGTGYSIGAQYGGTFTNDYALAIIADAVLATSTVSLADIPTIWGEVATSSPTATPTPAVYPPLNYYNDISLISFYSETWSGTSASSTLTAVSNGYYHIPFFIFFAIGGLLLWVWTRLLLELIIRLR